MRIPGAADQPYPWERYWVKSGTTIRMAFGGFLLDPSNAHGRALAGEPVRLGDLLAQPLLALEGDAGLGKSTAIQDAVRSARAQGQAVVSRTASDFQTVDALRTVLEAELHTHRDEASVEVFIDGVDEVAFGNQLSSFIDDVLTPAVRLRFVCRTAAWPLLLRQRIATCSVPHHHQGATTQPNRFFELLPLTIAEIRAAASVEAVDSDRFLTALQQRNVTALATRPLTLRMLLREFKENGHLPTSRWQLFRDACRRHCEEHNLVHRGVESRLFTSVDQRLRILARVACYSIFSNRPVIDPGPVGGAADATHLFLADIAGGKEEVEGATFVVDETSVRETLLTSGLISAAEGGCFTFGHRGFAEFLAAFYLTELRVPLPQLRGMLCHPSHPDRIITQLREVTAELCSVNAEFAEWNIARDATLVLGADFSALPVPKRKELVDTLLGAADQLQAVGAFAPRSVLSSVEHPGLANQLARVLRDHRQSFEKRDLAVDFASSCRLTGLTDALVSVVLDDAEAIALRVAAAHALVRMKASVGPRLQPLLSVREDTKGQDLLGCALELLWPDAVPGDPFACLTRPKVENHYGAYATFLLQTFPRRLRVDLLESGLDWARSIGKSDNGFLPLERARDAVLRLAWCECTEVSIRERLIPVLRDLLRQYEHLIPESDSDGDSERHATVPTSDLRRRVTEELCTFKPPDAQTVQPLELVFSRPPLLVTDDLEWVLGKVADASDHDNAKKWAEAASRLFWSDLSVNNADVLARASEASSQVYSLMAEHVQAVDPQSTRAADMRRSYLDYEQRNKPRSVKKGVLVQGAVPEALALVGNRGITWWPNVVHAAAAADPGRNRWSVEAVLKGVEESETDIQVQVAQTAGDFLNQCDDRATDWISENTFPYSAFAGYAAFHLLHALRPETYTDLLGRVIPRWAAAVLCAEDLGESRDSDTVFLDAYAANPGAMLAAARARALGENNSHGNVFILRRFAPVWDARVEELALSLLQEPGIAHGAVEEILGAALTKGSEVAVKLGLEIVERGASADDEDPQRAHGIAAATVLFGAVAAETWERLAKVMHRAPAYAREIFGTVAERARRDEAANLAKALGPNQLADLYFWLAREFPPADDPDEQGAHVISKREAIGQFRDMLLPAIAGSGHPESVAALRRICDAGRGRHLRHYLKLAEDRVLALNWGPLQPADVRALLADPRRRRVDSAAQLLEAVVEALGTIQERLHGSPRLAQFLWNTPSKGNPSRKDEAALADFLKDQLDRILSERRVLVHREVEIRRPLPGELGQKPDLIVSALPAAGLSREAVSVALEVKGDWHKEVETAMRTQLVRRYLQRAPLSAGVYVVGFFGSRRTKDRAKARLDQLEAQLLAQAKRLSNGQRAVRSVVLDCRLTLAAPDDVVMSASPVSKKALVRGLRKRTSRTARGKRR